MTKENTICKLNGGFFTFNGEGEDGNGYALELNYQVKPSEFGDGERELCFVDKDNAKFYPQIRHGIFRTDYGSLNLILIYQQILISPDGNGSA